MATASVLGLVGILLIIGFLADYLFRKTSLPDVVILVGLGYLAGPVLGIVNPSQLTPASQIIASLALVVILFNGGLDLEFPRIISGAPRAMVLVLSGIVISMAAATAFAYYVLHWELMNSLLLGAIVSGTSPSIVMPLVSRVRVTPAVASVLHLESAFNGALVIIIALVILQMMTTGEAGSGACIMAQQIAVRFLVGIAIGVVAGVLWLWVLSLIEGETYDDILTLAVVFVLFFVVENLQGSGAIFALTFGIMLGNGVRVAQFLRIRRTVAIHEMMMKFHSQMSFLIKTFFFVYLGMIIAFDKPEPLVVGVVLCFVLLLSRYIAVLLGSIRSSILSGNVGILTTMFPRGLSAAVVAELVVASGIPNASAYPSIIMAVIVSTVAVSAICIPIFTRRVPEKIEEQVEAVQLDSVDNQNNQHVI
jgi:cell volume regulation protein A